MVLDTSQLSMRYRDAAVNTATHEILLTDFRGTQQEQDLSEPPNCHGVGRVRHFRRYHQGWIANPLPIDPAVRSLSLAQTDEVRAQVFQNAVCNWRCWYCYVPFDLLSANKHHSRWVTAEQLVAWYQEEPDPARIIDLSGGQPDLTPEWLPWMMNALRRVGLDQNVYLWSDDNLSNDYFWQYLSGADIRTIRDYQHYGRVACFKGFDAQSFAFNTAAQPELFEQQFGLFDRFLGAGIDVYAYVTFTTPTTKDLVEHMRGFVERLQRLHPYLPLRTIPLQITEFSPMTPRLDAVKNAAVRYQHDALHVWQEELDRRYTGAERAVNIASLPR